ncbi:MAG: hypothetical protein K9N48_00365 [Verrucomicrobia bacterium]|nr:hypothetical protein [Verrucomicrobiota bacterium]MCF7707517.1 hypothetical protein [Verrucomicrobiota bacterium]
MNSSKRKIRGLNGIKTHADRAEQVRLPHQALLRVAWLEMEKYRQKIEKENAMQRLWQLESRIAEIEEEQRKLMEEVESHKKTDNLISGRKCKQQEQESCESGFKIQY